MPSRDTAIKVDGYRRFFLLALLLGLAGCQGEKWPAASATLHLDSATDRLFQKKLECGKLLARIEGSRLGPDTHADRGIFRENSVVFYSPSLNTCLYLDRFVLHGETVTSPKSKYNEEHASVEDLLTGQTIEEHHFNLDVQEESAASRTFEAQVVSQYGTEAKGR
jgi:hypothetical protein